MTIVVRTLKEKNIKDIKKGPAGSRALGDSNGKPDTNDNELWSPVMHDKMNASSLKKI